MRNLPADVGDPEGRCCISLGRRPGAGSVAARAAEAFVIVAATVGCGGRWLLR
ncbi:hypothetical protein [Amycolatopsis orientalis]|uniref:hypothetical protein n=1 Tax=Amycolatopsis orientalis TaxID=31958 RepID=UPI0003A8BE2C|nr:hypothetical protein [Amycolatopsis orientalis]